MTLLHGLHVAAHYTPHVENWSSAGIWKFVRRCKPHDKALEMHLNQSERQDGSRFSENRVCAASMSFSASSLFLLPSFSWVCRSTLRQYTAVSTNMLQPWCVVMAYSVIAAADEQQVRDEALTIPSQKMIGHR